MYIDGHYEICYTIRISEINKGKIIVHGCIRLTNVYEFYIKIYEKTNMHLAVVETLIIIFPHIFIFSPSLHVNVLIFITILL